MSDVRIREALAPQNLVIPTADDLERASKIVGSLNNERMLKLATHLNDAPGGPITLYEMAALMTASCTTEQIKIAIAILVEFTPETDRMEGAPE